MAIFDNRKKAVGLLYLPVASSLAAEISSKTTTSLHQMLKALYV